MPDLEMLHAVDEHTAVRRGLRGRRRVPRQIAESDEPAMKSAESRVRLAALDDFRNYLINAA
jgi:hypothetical protein